jgi:hypothetical protein
MKVLKLKVKQGKRQSLGRARRIKIRFHLALFAASLGVVCSMKAQTYSIDWHKIAGGGGTSTGGGFQMSGTIGQPDASGTMNGGNYSLTGGFWSLTSAVQTPGAPTLYICSSGNTVTVYWQNVGGCTLQQTSNAGAPNSWTTCPSPPTTSNGTNYVNITAPTGSQFFRLSRQ